MLSCQKRGQCRLFFLRIKKIVFCKDPLIEKNGTTVSMDFSFSSEVKIRFSVCL